MSRFWGGDDTDSESEEELSPDESTMHLTSRFARTSDSEDEDEVKRVVKSHKDKHLDTLQEISDNIDFNIDGKEYAALPDNFAQLNDALIKWKKAAKSSALAPPPYYEGLLSLQEFLDSMDKKTKASLDKKSARAVTALAQKFKKNLGKYKSEFEEYKAKVEAGAPVGGEDPEEQDEEDLESSKKEEIQEVLEPAGIDQWVTTGEEEEEGKGKKKRTRKRNNKKTSGQKAAAAAARGEWTVERVNEELKSIISGKAGKKKIDKETQVTQLRELLEKAKNVQQELAIRMNIISAHFDQTISMKQHLSRENWMIAHNEVVEVLNILEKNPSLRVKEAGKETDQFQTARLVAFLGRLRDELFKAFRALDSPAQEYAERVKDEDLLLETARQMQRYYRKINARLEVAEISLVRMAFLYYRRDSDVASTTPAPVRNSKVEIATFPNPSPSKGTKSEILDKMLAIICQDGNERMKSHALLYTIYHHALEKRFFEARDLLLMSHLQDQIQHADVPTQILFNRAMAQMGLCALRVGRIADAHNCLSELFQTNKLKELIAQGITQQRNQRDQDQDKIEKQRQVPYHTFMNTEQLECVHLVSAMLLETPNMVAPGYDAKKRVISRSFRRIMDFYDRQVFNGPPESPKDHIVAAARALQNAQADEAYNFILQLRCWEVYPDPENVKQILEKNIREVALQTFLLKNSGSFASVSVEFLAKTVGLSEKSVHTVVSRMMINEELHSCWHQPSGTVVMHQSEANKLQSLVLQYADKVETFVAENERTFENRTGGFGYDKRGNRDDDSDRKGQGWRDGGRRDGAGGRKYRDNSGKGRNNNYGGRSEYRSWDNRRN